MQRLTPLVKNLLIINVGCFLAQSLLGFDLIDAFGLRDVLSDHFKPYQFFTHLFVHANFSHLLSNMFALFMFGPILENTLGYRPFLAFYIITGIGAAVLYSGIHYLEVSRMEAIYHAYLANPDPESFNTYLNKFAYDMYTSFYNFVNAFFDHPNDEAYIAKSKAIVHKFYKLKADMPIVGASGAIFGILIAFAMLFPNVELLMLFVPIPIKAKYFVTFYGVYELYAGIQANPGDNVAHFAHLGGLLFGYLFIKEWKKKHPY